MFAQNGNFTTIDEVISIFKQLGVDPSAVMVQISGCTGMGGCEVPIPKDGVPLTEVQHYKIVLITVHMVLVVLYSCLIFS